MSVDEGEEKVKLIVCREKGSGRQERGLGEKALLCVPVLPVRTSVPSHTRRSTADPFSGVAE